MKKNIFIYAVLFINLWAYPANAAFYIGVEAGDSIPLAYLNKYFSHNWHAVLSFQVETDIKFIDVRLDSQYFVLKTDSKELAFYPLILNLVIKAPWEYAVKPYIAGGAGIVWEKLYINKTVLRNYDPVFSGGIGAEYLIQRNKWKFGPFIEGKYQFIYQKSMEQAVSNGEIILIYGGIKIQVF